jgi:hypothetical protein
MCLNDSSEKKIKVEGEEISEIVVAVTYSESGAEG